MPRRPADPMKTMPVPKGAWLYSLRFLDALEAASVMFATTVRKRAADDDPAHPGIPYVAHLLAVAAIVLEHGGTEDEAIAALLHDTLEDVPQQRRAEKTVRAFGEAVYSIVEGCTDGRPGKDGTKRPWRERKDAYLARMAREPAPTLLVSAADKLHNARAIVADLRAVGPVVWDRFNASRDDILGYYDGLVAAFRGNPASNPELVAELARTVDLMHGLATEDSEA